MKLKYETAVATLIQFVVLTILGVANALNSMISTCRHDGSNCTWNLILSVLFFLITAAWFGMIWMLGYFAQESRNKRLAQLLILVEMSVGLIAFFNARHNTDALGLATSIIDLMLAIWIITLAFRLMRADGKRITKNRSRKRKKA